MDSAIFVQRQQPLKFYMDACPEKEGIARAVQAHGGRMVDEPTNDCIELVPIKRGKKLQTTKRHQVYSFEFVQDSVWFGELMSLKAYELKREFPRYIPAKVKTRQRYSQRENQCMIEYQRRTPGNPCSTKYWEIALGTGLAVFHPPHSLRYHWEHIILKQITVAKENQAGTLKRRLKARDTPTKRVKISPSLHRKAAKEAGMSQSILEAFQKLVRRCCRSSGTLVSEQAVLATLLQWKGEVQPTLQSFAGSS